MVGLQEFIHKMELGEGVKWVKWTAVILTLLALATAYDALMFRNLVSEESIDNAQLARNIAQGKGYTTSFIRPFSAYRLQQHRADRQAPILAGHPDLANAPLYPVLLAGYMKVMPFQYTVHDTEKFRAYQPDILIAVFNQFWFVVALFFAYKIGKRLFSAGVAWFAAGILGCTELFWRISMWGGSTTLLLAGVLGAIYCLVRLEEGTREEGRSSAWFAGWAALAGLAMGLAALTRYSAGWLLLPVLAFYGLYFGARRKTVVIVTTVCFGALLTPWLARNYQVSGKLFGIAGYAIYEDTQRYPETGFQRQIEPDSITFEQYSIEDLLHKLMINTRQILQNDLPKMGGNWFSALFVAGLLVASKKPGQGRLRVFLLLLLATLVVVQALGRTHLMQSQPEISSENLLVLAVPLVFIYAAALCVELISQVPVAFPEMRVLINAGIWAIFSLPLVVAMLPPRPAPLSYPPYYPFIIQHAASVLTADDMVMTDMPWAMAWYGNRRAVSLALSMPDYTTISERVKVVNALYLTEITTDARFLSRLVKGEDKVWCRLLLDILLHKQVPAMFPLKNVWMDIGMPSQLFIADLERWKLGGK